MRNPLGFKSIYIKKPTMHDTQGSCFVLSQLKWSCVGCQGRTNDLFRHFAAKNVIKQAVAGFMNLKFRVNRAIVACEPEKHKVCLRRVQTGRTPVRPKFQGQFYVCVSVCICELTSDGPSSSRGCEYTLLIQSGGVVCSKIVVVLRNRAETVGRCDS